MEETTTLEKVVIVIEQINVTNVNQTFNNDCSICLDGIDNIENNGIVTIACGHKFHYECIHGYVVSQLQKDSNITCPICRLSIMDNKHELYVDARAYIMQMQTHAQMTNEPLTLQEQTWLICVVLGRMLVLLLIFAICVILVGLLLLFVL